MAHKLHGKAKGKAPQYRAPILPHSPATPYVSHTASEKEMGVNSSPPLLAASKVIEEFYAVKERLEELSCSSDSRKLTAKQLIDELEGYSEFMHRFLDRRQYGSSSMELYIPDNIQGELENARERLEERYIDLIMNYLSEQAKILINKSKLHPRAIELELDFSILGRRISYACATICVYNADIDRQEWQRFVPRCISHNVQITIDQLFEAHKSFQASFYLQNDVERVRLWYLVWKNLRKTFQLLRRNEDKFPSIDYCIESSFFRTKEIRELLGFCSYQADFFIPKQIEDIVGYYCQLIHEHHSQIKPRSDYLQGLNEKKPLSARAVFALIDFPEQHQWNEAALTALHWATVRLNHLTAGPVVLRRYGAKFNCRTLEGPPNQKMLKQPAENTEDGIQDAELNLPWLLEELDIVDQKCEEVVMDAKIIIKNNPSAQTRAVSKSTVLQNQDAFSDTKPSYLTAAPGGFATGAHYNPTTPASPRKHAIQSFPTSARISLESQSHTHLRSSGSRRSSLHHELPIPRGVCFTSPPKNEDMLSASCQAADDAESQDSVSMEISPVSIGMLEGTYSASYAPKIEVQLSTKDQQKVIDSKPIDTNNCDKSATQWQELEGWNQVSAYDYVYCPFAENRKYEVANGRLIPHNLRNSGTVSDGLRTQDLVNLPPAHCRTPGTFTFWEKRTPSGPYEVFKMFGSVLVGKLMGMKSASTTRPKHLPQITSRASCRHYRHVPAAKRNAQRVVKPGERRIPILRGGGIGGVHRFQKTFRSLPAHSFRRPRANSNGSPTPTGWRQQFQNSARHSTPEYSPRSRPQPQPQTIDLTGDEQDTYVEDEEEDFEIHEDRNNNSSARSSSSRSWLSNKENTAKQETAGVGRRPLQEREADKTPSIYTRPSPRASLTDFGRGRCHPCPLYQGQYHHYCWRHQDGHRGSDSSRSLPMPSPSRDGSQWLPVLQGESNALEHGNLGLFHDRLHVYLLEEGQARELLFPTELADLLSDYWHDNAIFAVEDGSMYVLRTVPGGGRALTVIADSIYPTAGDWRHHPAVWRRLEWAEQPLNWEVTPRGLIPKRTRPGEQLRFDVRHIGRIYQLTDGHVIRVVLINGQIDVQILERIPAPHIIPFQPILPTVGENFNASFVPGRGASSGRDPTALNSSTWRQQHPHYSRSDRPDEQSLYPSHRVWGAASPQRSRQEDWGRLGDRPRISFLHERLRNLRALAEYERSNDTEITTETPTYFHTYHQDDYDDSKNDNTDYQSNDDNEQAGNQLKWGLDQYMNQSQQFTNETFFGINNDEPSFNNFTNNKGQEAENGSEAVDDDNIHRKRQGQGEQTLRAPASRQRIFPGSSSSNGNSDSYIEADETPPVAGERSEDDGVDEAQVLDKQENPKRRGGRRRAGMVARNRLVAHQAAKQTTSRSGGRRSKSTPPTRTDMAEGGVEKPFLKKAADESETEDPKSKTDKRMDDDFEGRPGASHLLATVRRSGRIAEKRAAQAAIATPDITNRGAASGSPKVGDKGVRKRNRDNDIDSIANDNGNGNDTSPRPRKKPKHVESEPTATLVEPSPKRKTTF